MFSGYSRGPSDLRARPRLPRFGRVRRTRRSRGQAIAFDIYRRALLNLANKTITPATLHEEVRDLLVAKARREGMIIEEGVLPDVPDPFVLSIWEALLWVYSIQC